MTASRSSVAQIADMIEDIKNPKLAIEIVTRRLRSITGNSSLTTTCELVAQELLRRRKR